MNDTTKPQDRNRDDRSNRDDAGPGRAGRDTVARDDDDGATAHAEDADVEVESSTAETDEEQRAKSAERPQATKGDALLDLPARIEDSTAD